MRCSVRFLFKWNEQLFVFVVRSDAISDMRGLWSVFRVVQDKLSLKVLVYLGCQSVPVIVMSVTY